MPLAAVSTAPVGAAPRSEAAVLGELGELCEAQGLMSLSQRLLALQVLLRDDLEALEANLSSLPAREEGLLVRRCAEHLLALGGKRLRPLCVLLAARAGPRPLPAAADLAVAVELVHSATLLHDDVVDLGEQRRGAPAARLVYGNAASIFAGDWLLIEAMRRVVGTRLPGLLDRLLAVIEEMIFAESLQLAGRGRVSTDRGAYFRVIEGKTAALFRWAMFAGGRAGGLPEASCQALEDYGLHLGVAFQAVDDLLDLTGDERATGKALFADVREGKMTLPLILAAEREPALLGPLCELAAAPDEAPRQPLREEILQALRRTGAQEACLAIARERAAQAAACLSGLPPSPARAALTAVAEAAVQRDR